MGKAMSEKYLEQVLRTFNMSEAKAVVTPIGAQYKLRSLNEEELRTEKELLSEIPHASAVGSLMYAMVGSWPDLGYAVGLVSRYMGNPRRIHWEAVKWIMKYLAGTSSFCLNFTKNSNFRVESFCDADYARDLDRRRSVTGYVFQVEEML